jgi:hypothetical protein
MGGWHRSLRMTDIRPASRFISTNQRRTKTKIEVFFKTGT